MQKTKRAQKMHLLIYCIKSDDCELGDNFKSPMAVFYLIVLRCDQLSFQMSNYRRFAEIVQKLRQPKTCIGPRSDLTAFSCYERQYNKMKIVLGPF